LRHGISFQAALIEVGGTDVDRNAGGFKQRLADFAP
jgi:hypothetical protein